jgi:hypothetical protein
MAKSLSFRVCHLDANYRNSQKQKPTWRNTFECPSTSVYFVTSLPTKSGCPLSSLPTNLTQSVYKAEPGKQATGGGRLTFPVVFSPAGKDQRSSGSGSVSLSVSKRYNRRQAKAILEPFLHQGRGLVTESTLRMMLKKKFLTRLGCVAFVVLVSGLLSWPVLSSVYPFSFAADERKAQDRVASALPLGSPREEVERWLRTEGIAISQIVDHEGHSIGVSGDRPYTTWNGTWGIIVMEFYFGQDGKLSERVVYIDAPSLLALPTLKEPNLEASSFVKEDMEPEAEGQARAMAQVAFLDE